MADGGERLLSARFLTMCAFSFTVFLSAFQLIPTAPFRIVELGGSRFTAGLFLGLLTYASALTAPITGALADRFGRRRTLIASSLVLSLFAGGYAVSKRPATMLLLVAVHGFFWSGLLSASSAYTSELVPSSRRAEGIGYWGLATMLAVAVAPGVGLWLYQFGWMAMCLSVGALNLVMAGIAATLPEDRISRPAPSRRAFFTRDLVEWRILVAAFTMFLYAFGYGGVTSFAAMYARASGVHPTGIYFTAFAIVVILTRPFSGRLADRLGHVRVFVPCLFLIVAAYALLAMGGSRGWLLGSAAALGLGLGSAYPIFAAWILDHVATERRGAAFGSLLAAFDTGLGTGSIALGWVIEHHGYRIAFGIAAAMASLALPYFLLVGTRTVSPASAPRHRVDGHAGV
jgi:MFS family permease